MSHLATLRRFCQLTGLQVYARDYDFTSSAVSGPTAVFRLEVCAVCICVTLFVNIMLAVRVHREAYAPC